MSEQTPESNETSDLDSEEYGGLSVEDDPQGTVDPSDLAGTADSSDAEVGYDPNSESRTTRAADPPTGE